MTTNETVINRLYKQIEILSAHKDFNETQTIIDLFDAIEHTKSTQAATAEANKRMAELESEIEKLNTKIYHAIERHAKDDEVIKRYKETITKLQARDNTLREALEPDAAELIAKEAFLLALNGGSIFQLYKQPERNKLRTALSATPAESLQAHDDELIEECADIAISVTQFTNHQSVDSYNTSNDIAMRIRSLKGK